MKRILIAALLFAACSKEEKLKPEDNGNGQSDLSLADFNIDTIWVPSRKACDDTAVPFKDYETYRMNEKNLYALYMNEDTETRRCFMAEVYFRSIGSAKDTEDLYVEDGRFESANYAQQNCYRKENGQAVGEAEKTGLDVQLPSWDYKLERSDLRELVITSKNHPECLAGTLSLTLTILD
jgi:hypothetical protein